MVSARNIRRQFGKSRIWIFQVDPLYGAVLLGGAVLKECAESAWDKPEYKASGRKFSFLEFYDDCFVCRLVADGAVLKECAEKDALVPEYKKLNSTFPNLEGGI
ncbi:hypothetical protein HMPREF0496_0009 [Lentilactobacillus hilgardii ATCC 27305]|nr:hypothetical protein HMPREF0496_0009 [Lentilactobacillus hilgardii ATCC 27305]